MGSHNTSWWPIKKPQGDQLGPCTSYSCGLGHTLGWVQDRPIQPHEGTCKEMGAGRSTLGQTEQGVKGAAACTCMAGPCT